MESWLDSRYNGQADKLPALLQAIGWNYRVQCKFTDSKGNAVQGVSAIPLIQAGGQEYQLVDGVSPKNSSQTETQDDGELLFSECFPGDKNKTVLRVKYQGTTQDIKDKINIPWSTPTNKVFSAKDIVVTDCIPFMPRNAKSWNYELMIYPQGKDCQGKDLRLHRLCVSFHDGKIDSGSGKTIGTCNQDPQEISGTYDNCTGKFSFTYKVADYWNYRGGNTIEWEGTVEGAWPKPGESTFCNAKVSGIQRRVCSDRNALGCDNKIFNCSDAFAGRAADYKYCPKTP
jgi:hypothetical protein